VLNELKHSRHRFDSTVAVTVGSVSPYSTLSFIWSGLSAPVELSSRYTTADIVLEMGSTSASVRPWNNFGQMLSAVSSQRNERKVRKERKNGKLQPIGTELSSFLLKLSF